MADLKDCGSLSSGIGPGLGIEAEMGMLAYPSLGIGSATKRVGFENRHVVGIWNEYEVFGPLTTAFAYAQNLEGHYDISYGRAGEREHLLMPRLGSEYHYQKEGRWINFKEVHPGRSLFTRATNIELGISVFLVSARVGINPLEIIDYLLGFVGMDIAKDDPECTKANHKPDPNGD